MKHLAQAFFVVPVIALIGCSGLHLKAPLKTSESDWPMFARTGLRQAFVREALIPPLIQAWEQDITGGIGNGSPLIADTVLVIGNLRGELHAISINSGKRIGWVDIGEAIKGAPAIVGSIAYVALSNTNESLIAFDLVAGKPLWKKSYGDIEVSPLLLEEKLYFGTTDGTFLCVSCESGNTVWKFELPDNKRQKGIRSSAATDGKHIVFGTDEGSIYALDAMDGKVQWRYQTSGPVEAAPSIKDDLVTIGNIKGELLGLSLATGTLRWSVSLHTGIYATTTYAGESVLVGTTGGKMAARRMSDGTQLWETNVNGVVNSQGAVAGRTLYVGTLSKELFALNTDDGSIIWKQKLGGRIKSAPAIAHGKLFVATDDRTVIAFREAGE